MALNYIFVFFFVIAFVIALVKFIFLGDTLTFKLVVEGMLDMAEVAVMDIALPLAGVMTFFLGILNVGEKAGAINVLARVIGPFFNKLFPEVPRDHPANGEMIMNFAANMIGLDNAATPFGLKAMQSLQQLNPDPDTASNAQIMFLVLHTSGLQIIPLSIIAQRAILGAESPSDVFIPCVVGTYVTTVVSMLITATWQRLNIFNRTIMFGLGGLYKKVNVFNAFIDGAKNGFSTSVVIIPYLVGMLVAIAAFRACGAMDYLVDSLKFLFSFASFNTEFTDALPVALMKPLSGSGARALMIDAMKEFGPDSFIGRLVCIFQGSADTTLYIVALYFGSVGIKNTRYAIVAGLIADFVGVLAGIWLGYLFFH